MGEKFPKQLALQGFQGLLSHVFFISVLSEGRGGGGGGEKGGWDGEGDRGRNISSSALYS